MRTKEETIQYLTDLMGVIANAYYKKGMFTPLEYDSNSKVRGDLRVHENSESGISIDLYHFEGDGLPVCEGLKPCTITCDDGKTTWTGNVFCMCYNPDDDIQPLVFMFEPYDNVPDIDIDADDMPEEVLKNVVAWLEQAMVPAESENDVTEVRDIIALWSDWCMGYDDENLWLDYMVKHPRGHCNRQHLQEKWDSCYKKYGNKAAMNMFWRELDNNNRTILTEYITTRWHKK